MNVRVIIAALLALAAVAHTPASAQAPLRIVYPYAAGGAGDVAIRMLADRMQTSLGRPVIVENRAGGGGRIGVSAVKNAAPDGNTFLFTPFAAVTIFPVVYRSIDYDPFTQLAPVSQICEYDFAIAVREDHPAKTPAELLAWLKANPLKAQYGSPGAGALPHFFGLMIGKAAGVEMQHIPYPGTPPALNDLLGGNIPMVTSTASEFVELHQGKKIRVIAVSGKRRLSRLPEVPTFKESGIDIEGGAWYAMFAPAGTPADAIAKVNAAVNAALKDKEVMARFDTFGFVPTGTTPDELRTIQKAAAERWTPVIKASGFQAD
jgi:tripartite-type tricarboxylate transporter receptor subunit TctC